MWWAFCAAFVAFLVSVLSCVSPKLRLRRRSFSKKGKGRPVQLYRRRATFGSVEEAAEAFAQLRTRARRNFFASPLTRVFGGEVRRDAVLEIETPLVSFRDCWHLWVVSTVRVSTFEDEDKRFEVVLSALASSVVEGYYRVRARHYSRSVDLEYAKVTRLHPLFSWADPGAAAFARMNHVSAKGTLDLLLPTTTLKTNTTTEDSIVTEEEQQQEQQQPWWY
eukprot:CAMPEP_0118910252 /NCGR_PEP_ID=MMETSP1166-20130328/12476_1 /TAXON_ID=1104430 /ORGANISM="Chrysoreinhardia sp, Strain CCMP3193" /LENGTH=220 /DNA_ID=CAMNT_0006849711 /DNA_START=17 /DNA_END=679 /DNA_ORIENTATION=-